VEHYAGLDVSLELSSVCIVDGPGGIVCEAKVASEPEALVRFLRGQRLEIVRVGLEAGPLSQWLHAGADRSRPGDGAAGDAACEGSLVGDDAPCPCKTDTLVGAVANLAITARSRAFWDPRV
jgi:hypothetical protein